MAGSDELLNALATVSGWNAPQNIVGLGKLIKEGFVRPSNVMDMRAGPGGTIMYPSGSIDSPAAATGSFIEYQRGANDPDVMKHELRHARQSNILGPAYLPLGIHEAISDEYGSGPLERDAIRHATPQSEMLREGASMNRGASHPMIQKLLEFFGR